MASIPPAAEAATSRQPVPVAAAAMTRGTTAIGATTVTEAAKAERASCQRGTGRSHRYTSVPSSDGSPRDAEANTRATTGTSSDRP